MRKSQRNVDWSCTKSKGDDKGYSSWRNREKKTKTMYKQMSIKISVHQRYAGLKVSAFPFPIRERQNKVGKYTFPRNVKQAALVQIVFLFFLFSRWIRISYSVIFKRNICVKTLVPKKMENWLSIFIVRIKYN